MAISRVTTWSQGQVLTASALNSEFDNVINNALSLISPLTGTLNANGNRVSNLAAGSIGAPGIQFTGDSDTGIAQTVADVLDLVTAGTRVLQIATSSSGAAVNFVRMNPAGTGAAPVISADGESHVGLRLITQGTGFVTVKRGASRGGDMIPSLGIDEEGGTGLVQLAAGVLFATSKHRPVASFEGVNDATNYVRLVSNTTGGGVTVIAGGGDTNVSLALQPKGAEEVTLGSSSSTMVRAATVFVPASLGNGPALSNTPVQHGLYRENVVKGYINFKGTSTASVYASYNVGSLARTNTGEYTVTWARAFAATPYAVVGNAFEDAGAASVVAIDNAAGAMAVGSVGIITEIANTAGAVDAEIVTLIAVGGQ